jgi:predicted DNA-binding ribbon-helix-helix protein
MTALINRNVLTDSIRTSMRMEQEFWDALDMICRERGITQRQLIAEIDGTPGAGGRTSKVRTYTLNYYRSKVSAA